jgi:excisionase family DNA binding protein
MLLWVYPSELDYSCLSFWNNEMPLLTIKDAAHELGLKSDQTLYRWIKRHWLPAIPLGPRGVRIKSEVIDQIKNCGLRVTPASILPAIGKPRTGSRKPPPNGGKAWR